MSKENVEIFIRTGEQRIRDEGQILIAATNKPNGNNESQISIRVKGMASIPVITKMLTEMAINIARNNPCESVIEQILNEFFVLNTLKENISQELNRIDPTGFIRKSMHKAKNKEENDNE